MEDLSTDSRPAAIVGIGADLEKGSRHGDLAAFPADPGTATLPGVWPWRPHGSPAPPPEPP